jgi:predicted signal transduction protein with EAL and GGDEF domain
MDKKDNTYDHTIDSANSYRDCLFLHPNDYAEFIEKSQSVIQDLSPQKHLAILSADITDFRTIDTFYGFAEGERMLKAFSNFLHTSENILVCNRVFSDHFVCLLVLRQNSMSEGKVAFYRKKLNWFLSKQQIYHPDCYLHIACGLCELKTNDWIHAINNANTARKRLKLHSDTTVAWFDEQMNQQIHLEEQTAHLAQAALREKQYCFFLQPKVNLHTGQIIGAEALARSITEDGQMMLPDQFIPFLERNGSIIDIDYLMCRKCAEKCANT